jgi:hypothetical protein
LIPVVVIPCTKYFCNEKKRIKQGTSERTDMANIGPHDDMPEESKNSLSPMGTVYFGGEFR